MTTPASNYINFNQGKALPWLGAKYGRKWSAALGAIENSLANQALYAGQARFATTAPLDALPLALHDRAMSQSFNDALPPWLPSHAYVQNDIVLDPAGFVWSCLTGGTSSSSQPIWPNPPNLNQTQHDGPTLVWIFQGQLAESKTRAWLRSAFTGSALESPLPIQPLAPGFYYSGTDIGLIAAFTNSGIYAPPIPNSGVPAWAQGTTYNRWDFVQDNGGNVWQCLIPGTSTVYPTVVPAPVPPRQPFPGDTPTILDLVADNDIAWIHASVVRIYTNNDFFIEGDQIISSGHVRIVGAMQNRKDITVSINAGSDSVTLTTPVSPLPWGADNFYDPGVFIDDGSGNIYFTVRGGLSGNGSPFNPPSPIPPPVYAANLNVTDNGVVWTAAKFFLSQILNGTYPYEQPPFPTTADINPGVVLIGASNADTAWRAATDYNIGDLVVDQNNNRWRATIAGTSGDTVPFPNNPTLHMNISDPPSLGPLQWNNRGKEDGAWGLEFTGTFSGIGSADVARAPDPPDGKGWAWGRFWLVLPLQELTAQALPWDYDTSGAVDWPSSTHVTVGQIIEQSTTHGPIFWICTTAGLTNFSQPNWTDPSPITDGTAVWSQPVPSSPALPALQLIDTWQATTVYSVGDLVRDNHGHGWEVVVGGTSGAMEPSWPPIPTAVPPATDFTDGDGIEWRCSWDGNHPWLWDGIPTVDGLTLASVPSWNTEVGDTNGESIYGLVADIVSKWAPAHMRFIGAWLVFDGFTRIDTPYPFPPPWNEVSDITINSVTPIFSRYASEL